MAAYHPLGVVRSFSSIGHGPFKLRCQLTCPLLGSTIRLTLATRAANTLQQSLDLPRNALTYLLSHGSLDIQHVDFFKNLMDQLEDAGDRQAVVHAARRFYILYGNIFRTLDNASGQPAEAA